MIRSWKLARHKARASCILRDHLAFVPGGEGPDALEERLALLSERDLDRGATPVDTAFACFAELAAEACRDGGCSDAASIRVALGSCFALRGQMYFFCEHIDALQRVRGAIGGPL